MSWQEAIALLLVLAAALFLLRRAWRLFAHRNTGCGACPSCPTSHADKPEAIRSIDPLPRDAGS